MVDVGDDGDVTEVHGIGFFLIGTNHASPGPRAAVSLCGDKVKEQGAA
jgi:hypothetical protein